MHAACRSSEAVWELSIPGGSRFLRPSSHACSHRPQGGQEGVSELLRAALQLPWKVRGSTLTVRGLLTLPPQVGQPELQA